MNTWKSQEMLMVKSGQYVADKPEVNKGSVLYAALILEEVSELIEGLGNALSEYDTMNVNLDMFEIRKELSYIKDACKNSSRSIRSKIPLVNDFHFTPSEDVIVEIADGTTDITVVNCGFAVASGIPGEECFDDVLGSNLSKANPETGVIDKTPDGKWIKGVNYREPNLRKVIFK